MPEADILIVGSGPAGLSTAGALKQVGFESILLDRGERIGQSWEERYDRLHLHTVRDFSGLAHFPIRRTYPKYLSKDQYAQYLREYAAAFELKVLLRTRVSRVRQEEKGGRARWVVEAGSEAWLGRVVVIATGQYSRPLRPDWPGLAQYRGHPCTPQNTAAGELSKTRRRLSWGRATYVRIQPGFEAIGEGDIESHSFI